MFYLPSCLTHECELPRPPPPFKVSLSPSTFDQLNFVCSVCALEFNLNKVSVILHKPLTRINQLFRCIEAT